MRCVLFRRYTAVKIVQHGHRLFRRIHDLKQLHIRGTDHTFLHQEIEIHHAPPEFPAEQHDRDTRDLSGLYQR